MRNHFRVAITVPMLLGAVLLAGCAESSTDDPASTGAAAPGADAASETTNEPDTQLDLDAAWLDDGRMVAIVTTGSSTCIPEAGDITADGQSVSVTLDEGDPNQACTADLVARASIAMLPAGVVQTQDVVLARGRAVAIDQQ